MVPSKDLWTIDDRPSTRTKLAILESTFDVWLTIWNRQEWVSNEWYVFDLFAGKGKYLDQGKELYGSPLIFLKKVAEKAAILKKNLVIHLFFVEIKKSNSSSLEGYIQEFKKNNSQVENLVKIEVINADCNKIIDKIINQIDNTEKHPLFVLIDPTGLQIKKKTIEKIVQLRNPKDIMLNYILEGVRRTSGIAQKAHRGENLTIKEIKTLSTLGEFIGEDVNVIDANDIAILKDYISSIFTSKDLKVVAYDMKYPNRNDILYYLLFASRKLTITNIVKKIFARQKEQNSDLNLFGKDFYQNNILTVAPKVLTMKRKSLLYKTKVEYGDWTINHILGCMHGCKYPCYAMMMAKKFGWVKGYEDWRTPRIAENALELLEKEIPKHKNEIDFVHLCFMTDPFMYDYEEKTLVPQVKELTLKIIERLNEEGIKVTTLTKGLYPDEILDKKRFSQDNEYGITLVSLNEKFKEDFEPFSAPYADRIASLKKLADNGLKTWVSMEPYPTPELDIFAERVEAILEKISFAKKIIFGKLNYRRLTQSNAKPYKKWKNSDDFYATIARKVKNFCEKRGIKYHIKFGTPLNASSTTNIFKE